jgi:hypothetical protein
MYGEAMPSGLRSFGLDLTQKHAIEHAFASGKLSVVGLYIFVSVGREPRCFFSSPKARTIAVHHELAVIPQGNISQCFKPAHRTRSFQSLEFN